MRIVNCELYKIKRKILVQPCVVVVAVAVVVAKTEDITHGLLLQLEADIPISA